MGGFGVEGGVLIAVAAAIWLLYLVPTWWRRREYLSTERNAVRLQQTLRVMAQTSEVPEAIEIEAKAHEVAARQRALREELRQAEAIAKAQSKAEARNAARLAQASGQAASVSATSRREAAVRLRRARLGTTLFLVAAVVATVAGVPVLAAGGGGILLAGGLVGGTAALVMLRRMAVSGLPVTAPAARPSAPPLRDYAPTPREAAESTQPEQQREWTPAPVPKPRYLEQRAPLVTSTSPEALEQLRAGLRKAAENTERELSERDREAAEAQLASIISGEAKPAAADEADAAGSEVAEPPAAESQPAPAAPAPAGPPSRWASMGVVEQPAESSMPNIDTVLQRRRAAG